jgi:hypothetical protein
VSTTIDQGLGFSSSLFFDSYYIPTQHLCSMPTSPSFVISPPSPSPPRTHTHDNDHPLPHPLTHPDPAPPLLRHDSHDDRLDATRIINKHRMQYQGQGQASGSGTNGGGESSKSTATNNPRPLRAPAPGPLNLNYPTHQQNLSHSQMANFQFQNASSQNQNQNQGYSNPMQQGYLPTQSQYPISNTGRRMSGNEISPFQTTNLSLPSGSASSSPTNTFTFSNPPYMNLDRSGRGEPMGSRPLPMAHLPGPQVPSEPRMGHYSNYQTYPQPHPQYDQWPQPQQGQEPMSSSRRSTISNPSDHERINQSRPSTSEAVKAQDPAGVKVEPAQVEEDDEKMDHRKRKRNRTIRSCVPCHNHKRKVGSGCLAKADW